MMRRTRNISAELRAGREAAERESQVCSPSWSGEEPGKNRDLYSTSTSLDKQKPAQYQLARVALSRAGSFFSFGLFKVLHLVGFGTTAHEPRLRTPLTVT